MADPQIIREWLDKADEDFDFAESVLEDAASNIQEKIKAALKPIISSSQTT